MAQPAAAAPGARPLRLVTLNVNGLADEGKRHAIFGVLMRRHYDVVVLQETHTLNDAVAERWAAGGAAAGQPWPGQRYWCHGNSASRGVAVLIKDGAPVTGVRVGHRDAHGRLLRVDFTYAGVPACVLAVYAPCVPAERPAFFSGPFLEALPGPGAAELVLVGGDWNCVLDVADQFQPPGGNPAHRLRGGPELQAACVVGGGLVDAWRVRHPNRRAMMTRTSEPQTAGATGARLDRWLVPVERAHWVGACEVCPKGDFPLADHQAVTLRLDPPSVAPRGPGLWTFPLPLLDDVAFGTHLRDVIRAVPHTGSARGHWEAVKAAVKEAARAYSWEKQRRRRREDRDLQRRVVAASAAVAVRPLDALACAELREATAALQAARMAEARRNACAADVLWQDYGESSTLWFHRLGHAASPKDAIAALKDPAGNVHNLAQWDGVRSGGEVLRGYFGGLFAGARGDAAAQAMLLAATGERVPRAEAEACEGPPLVPGGVPAAALADALRRCPRGKRPGSDGLPYEFYTAYWDVVGPLLAAAVEEAFGDEGGPAPLPPSMREGVISLIHKGDRKPLDDPNSYRPITLLNADYKLLAKVLSMRMADALADVIDPTQTAFLPGRWIGDNVLFHLEEIDYAAATGLTGAIIFLDFEKAYDRVDREWMHRCVAHLGFLPRAQRWVRVLLTGTVARVAYNGFRTQPFDVVNSVQQGSPLSTVLYVLQAQPLASYLRHLTAIGRLTPLPLPGGGAAPPCQQHADDTTLHVTSLEQGKVAMDEGVQLYCRASNARLAVSKSKGLGLGALAGVTGTDPITGVEFLPRGGFKRHLGVNLCRPEDAAAAADDMFRRMVGAVVAKVKQWGRTYLTYMGRVHVAKQALASTVYYHAAFVEPPPAIVTTIAQVLYGFMGGAPAPAMEDGSDVGGVVAMRPGLVTAALPSDQGGVAAVDIRMQVTALQAKNVALAMHPRAHPWKALVRAQMRAAAPPGVGEALPFMAGAADGGGAGGGRRQMDAGTSAAAAAHAQPPLSARVAGYIRAARDLEPHRLAAVDAMSFHQVMAEPLLFNRRITDAWQQVLTPTRAPGLAAHGAGRLRDLRSQVRAVGGDLDRLPAVARAAVAVLPPAWREHVLCAEPPPASHECDVTRRLVRAHGSGVWEVRPDGRLRGLGEADAADRAAAAVGWEPALVVAVPRPRTAAAAVAGRVGDAGEAPPGEAAPAPPPVLYLVGPWRDVGLDPTVWGYGMADLVHYTVKGAALRGRELAALDAAGSRRYRPGLGLWCPAWEAGGGEGGLAAADVRWEGRVLRRQAAAASAGSSGGSRRRRREEREFAEFEPEPWLRDSFTWERQQDAEDQRGEALAEAVSASGRPRRRCVVAAQARAQALASAAPPRPATRQSVWGTPTSDVADRCAAPDASPDVAAHRRAVAPYRRLALRALPREVRVTAWRALHLGLHCGAFLAAVDDRVPLEGAYCQAPCCAGQRRAETLTHALLGCPEVAPAGAWLRRLWGRLTQRPPPLDARVFVADDQRVWEPSAAPTGDGGESPKPAAVAELWTLLRAALVHVAWSRRGWQWRQALGEEEPPAGAVAKRVAEEVVRVVVGCIWRDWMRATADPRSMSSVCASWFRGRDPSIGLGEFRDRWCAVGAGALCAVAPGGRLLVRLSVDSPEPWHAPEGAE